MFRSTVERPDFREWVRSVDRDARVRIGIVLDQIGQETVEYLQSYTNDMVPPAFPGGPWRPAHVGGWGDITFDLRDSYRYEVTDDLHGSTLAMMNDSDHARYVEAMEGLFVLSGIFDGSSGDINTIIRNAIHRVAPGWTTTR